MRLGVRNGDASPLTAYLKAQEGEFQLPGVGLGGRAGAELPVVHLDQAGPLRSDRDGRVLVDGPWGIYFRIGRTGTAITGGGLPVLMPAPALDPYGPDNPAHAAEPDFEEFFTSGLAAALRRFRGHSDDWRATPAGGIVSHTPDNYPICDWALPNAYAIVDSGHGFKMLALGRLAADEVLGGRRVAARAVPARPLRARRDARRVEGSVSVDLGHPSHIERPGHPRLRGDCGTFGDRLARHPAASSPTPARAAVTPAIWIATSRSPSTARASTTVATG